MPVEDEFERALVSMHAGLLSGSRIAAAGLASLQEHLKEAPAEEREAVHAAVTQIFNAQAHLNASVESLPASSWQRFKAMASMLKAQQTLLDELDQLLKAHVIARELEEAENTPLPAALQPLASSPMPVGEDLLAAFEALEASRARDARRAHDIRRAHHARRAAVDDQDDEPRSLLSAVREWTSGFRGLAAMVLAAAFLSLLPRDIKLQDLATKLVAMVGTETESAASAAANPPEVASSSPPGAPARLSEEAIAPNPDVGTATDRPRPLATAPPDQRRATGPAPSPQDIGAVTDRADRPVLAELGDKRLARAAIDEPTAPPGSAPEEQFVPVVFTHKDYAAVLQTLADLKQQYPSILSGRKEAVQPVDLGKKGVWHRLVFLPAGPRPVASKLCDELMAAGYDRCWVKEY